MEKISNTYPVSRFAILARSSLIPAASRTQKRLDLDSSASAILLLVIYSVIVVACVFNS